MDCSVVVLLSLVKGEGFKGLVENFDFEYVEEIKALYFIQDEAIGGLDIKVNYVEMLDGEEAEIELLFGSIDALKEVYSIIRDSSIIEASLNGSQEGVRLEANNLTIKDIVGLDDEEEYRYNPATLELY